MFKRLSVWLMAAAIIAGSLALGMTGPGTALAAGLGPDDALTPDNQWTALADCGLCAPEAVPVPSDFALVGNAPAAYGERLAPEAANAPRLPALPSAAALLRLAPAGLAAGHAVPASQALPLYVRDKVAQTTAERDALRQAAAQTTTAP